MFEIDSRLAVWWQMRLLEVFKCLAKLCKRNKLKREAANANEENLQVKQVTLRRLYRHTTNV